MKNVELPLPPIDNPQLWLEAVTHSSYCHEHGGGQSYDRLEFLGDAVLGFVVGQILYERYPHFSEAELTRLRSQLVNQKQLAVLAQALGLGEKLRLGQSLAGAGGREKPSLLSDVFEAVVGACLVDQGLPVVEQWLINLFNAVLEKWEQQRSSSGNNTNPQPKPALDPKNALQQWAQKKMKELPTYQQLEVTGPAHDRHYVFSVSIGGRIYGQGAGASKQEATKQAAIDALKKIKNKQV